MIVNLIKSFVSVFFILTLSNTFAQDEVNWSFDFDNQTNELVFTAELKEHWHLYSQFIDENLGPIPTTFEFEENEFYHRTGDVKEMNVKTIMDENFGGELDILEGKVVFSQGIVHQAPTNIKGSILYMLCDDKGCLPPDVIDFNIKVN